MSGEDSFRMRLLHLQPSEAWTKEPGHEEELTFVFVKAGLGTYLYQNSTQRLVAGNMLFVCGRTTGKLCAESKSDCVFITFSALFEHIYPLFSNDEIALLDRILSNFRVAKIYPASSSIVRDCAALTEDHGEQSVLVQRSQILRIVATVLADEFKAVKNQRSGQNWADDHVLQTFEKLSSNELLNLSVDDLAARFNCSRRHLNRLFHQHFNLSITALRMEIRLLKAISLLRNPQAKVINVAEQCGFNHLGLFNTCFKRRFGVSPGQWRKDSPTDVAPKANADSELLCPLQANKMCPMSGTRDALAQPDRNGGATALFAKLVEPKLLKTESLTLSAKARSQESDTQLRRHDA